MTYPYEEMKFDHNRSLEMMTYTSMLADIGPWTPYGGSFSIYTDAALAPACVVDTIPYTGARVIGLCQIPLNDNLDALSATGFQYYAAPIFGYLGLFLFAHQYYTRARAWSSQQILNQYNTIRDSAELPRLVLPQATPLTAEQIAQNHPTAAAAKEQNDATAAQKKADAKQAQRENESSGPIWLLVWLDGAIFKNLNEFIEKASHKISKSWAQFKTVCVDFLRKYHIDDQLDAIGKILAAALAYPAYWLVCALRWIFGINSANNHSAAEQHAANVAAANDFYKLFHRAYERIKRNRYYSLFFHNEVNNGSAQQNIHHPEQPKVATVARRVFCWLFMTPPEEEISHFRKFLRKINDAFWSLYNYIGMYSFLYWIWIYSTALHYGSVFYTLSAHQYPLFLFAGSFGVFVVACPLIGFWLIHYFVPQWAKLYYKVEIGKENIGETLDRNNGEHKINSYEDFRRNSELGYISSATRMAILIQQASIETQREAANEKRKKLRDLFAKKLVNADAAVANLIACCPYPEFKKAYNSVDVEDDSSRHYFAPRHIQGALDVLSINSTTYDAFVLRSRSFISAFVANFLGMAFALWPVGDFLGFLVEGLATGAGANWIGVITCALAVAVGLWEGNKAQFRAGLVAERNADFARKIDGKRCNPQNNLSVENEIIAAIWQRNALIAEIKANQSLHLTPGEKSEIDKWLDNGIYDPESDPNAKTLRYLEEKPWYDHGIGLFLTCLFIFEYRFFTGVLFMRFWFVPGSFATVLAWVMTIGTFNPLTQPVVAAAMIFGLIFAFYKVWEFIDARKTNNAYAKALSVINSVEAQEAKLEALKHDILLLQEVKGKLSVLNNQSAVPQTSSVADLESKLAPIPQLAAQQAQKETAPPTSTYCHLKDSPELAESKFYGRAENAANLLDPSKLGAIAEEHGNNFPSFFAAKPAANQAASSGLEMKAAPMAAAS